MHTKRPTSHAVILWPQWGGQKCFTYALEWHKILTFGLLFHYDECLHFVFILLWRGNSNHHINPVLKVRTWVSICTYWMNTSEWQNNKLKQAFFLKIWVLPLHCSRLESESSAPRSGRHRVGFSHSRPWVHPQKQCHLQTDTSSAGSLPDTLIHKSGT